MNTAQRLSHFLMFLLSWAWLTAVYSAPALAQEEEFYTVLAGSYISVDRAEKDFLVIQESLAAADIDYLRIEIVGGYATLRLGKFKQLAPAEELRQRIQKVNWFRNARVLSAYVKPERIVKLHRGPEDRPLTEREKYVSLDYFPDSYLSQIDNRIFYSVQLASFSQKELAFKEFDRLLQTFSAEITRWLRVEHVQKYHTIRAGKYAVRAEAEAVYAALVGRYPQADIFKVYIRPQRVSRIYLPEGEAASLAAPGDVLPTASSAEALTSQLQTVPLAEESLLPEGDNRANQHDEPPASSMTAGSSLKALTAVKAKKKVTPPARPDLKELLPAASAENFTVQVASFSEAALAFLEYDRLVVKFDESELEHLRIEFINGFFAVRLGKFASRQEAEQLRAKVRQQYKNAAIIYAYILPERIQKSFSPGPPAERPDAEQLAAADGAAASHEPAPLTSASDALPSDLADEPAVDLAEQPTAGLENLSAKAPPEQAPAEQQPGPMVAEAEKQAIEPEESAPALDEPTLAAAGGGKGEAVLPEKAPVTAEPTAEPAQEQEKFTAAEAEQDKNSPAASEDVAPESADDVAEPDSDSGPGLAEVDLSFLGDAFIGHSPAETPAAEPAPVTEKEAARAADEPAASGKEAEALKKSKFSFEVVTVLNKDDRGENIRMPSALFFDSASDELYLINGVNNRIIVYGPDYFPQNSLGKGRGLDSPLSGAIDKQGNIFVTQAGTPSSASRLSVLNSAYLPEREIKLDKIPGQEGFVFQKIAVLKDGSILVSGLNSDKVLVLDAGGGFKKWFYVAVDKKGDYVFHDGSTDPEKKAIIKDVVTDSLGNLFFLSEDTSKIYVFSPDEKFLFSFGTKGGAEGKMSRPRGLAIDEQKRCFYVVDYMRHTVLVYDFTGAFRYEFGGRGWGPEWFNYPVDIVLGRQGHVVVADFFNQRVQVFEVTINEALPERPPALWTVSGQ